MTRATASRITWLWRGAAVVLIGFAPAVWTRTGMRGAPSESWLAVGQTPLDRPSAPAAVQWTFLSDAERVVEPGASYTILAPTREEEMNLLAMSLGVLVGHLPYPNSYFGVEYPGYAEPAQYVLDFGCRHSQAIASDRVVAVRGGCVLRKRAAAGGARKSAP